MFDLLCATNIGGIILLVAVVLFLIYSIVSFALTVHKRRKERKERLAAKSALENVSDERKPDDK